MKEDDDLAGYSENREQNYEIKYLRKVLGQVDKRIQIPEAVNAGSLRMLIDDIEPATPRDIASRRKRLTLRVGIAYAAAFALIVALFYSMNIYKPEMINGGMRIADNASPSEALVMMAAEQAPEAGAGENTSVDYMLVEEPVEDTADVNADIQTELGAEDAPESTDSAVLGVGGLESSLLLRQDGYAYYWSKNDDNDPHKAGYPITLEIVSLDDDQLVDRIDVEDMRSVEKFFVSGDKIMLVGSGNEGIRTHVYSADGQGGYDEISSEMIIGTFTDARLYEDTLYVAAISLDAGEISEPVMLPHAADESAACIIQAFDANTLAFSAKAFIGAGATVHFEGINAYIYYHGEDDNGQLRDYTAKVNLDGTSIELESVS